MVIEWVEIPDGKWSLGVDFDGTSGWQVRLFFFKWYLSFRCLE